MRGPRLSFRYFLAGLYFKRRERVGIMRDEVKRRVGLVCGHAGYVTGLFEYIMTDMLALRAFALAGCGLIVTFQAVQPKIQWISAGWNSVYCLINMYHIRLLLLERPRPLTEDEQRLLEVLGRHIPARQILELVEAGEWRRFPPDSKLLQEGQALHPAEALVIVSGSCDVHMGGLSAGGIDPGAVLGAESEALRLLEEGSTGKNLPAAETDEKLERDEGAYEPPPEEPLTANMTVVAGSEVLCLALPWALLKSNRAHLEVLHQGFLDSVTARVAAADACAKLLEYGAILEMACAASLEAARQQAAAEEAERAASIEAARQFVKELSMKKKAQMSAQKTRWSLRTTVDILEKEEEKRAEAAAPVPTGPGPELTQPMLIDVLKEFRSQHNITDEEHLLVANTLSQYVGSSLLGSISDVCKKRRVQE